MSAIKEDQGHQIVKLYLSGLSMNAVGGALGISRQRIHQVLKRLGVRRRPNRPRKEVDLAQAFEMRKNGCTWGQIAKHFGVSITTISTALDGVRKPRKIDADEITCRVCGQTKPKEEFYSNQKGLRCKKCHVIYMTAWKKRTGYKQPRKKVEPATKRTYKVIPMEIPNVKP
jgi:DNA invertase Pin-like site-specific DNA recombinase